jgi:hypothetical protein
VKTSLPGHGHALRDVAMHMGAASAVIDRTCRSIISESQFHADYSAGRLVE